MQPSTSHGEGRKPLRVAYLINQYPATPHTFIRREIGGIEVEEIEVGRFTIRRAREPLADEEDAREARRTRALLEAGAGALARATVGALARAPGRFLGALATALRCGLRSERGVARHVACLAEAALLERWLRAEGFGHLHAHFGTNPAMVAMLSRMLGGPPYSFTAHGIDAFERPEMLSIREKVHEAEFVVAVSDHGLRTLRAIAEPDDADRIRLVRCPIPDEILEQAPGLPPDARRLVFVGRLSEEKDPMALVRAVTVLVGEFADLELTMVGDGPLRPALERDLDESGLRGSVHLAGWCDEAAVRREVGAARALVLPSRSEGLPIAILEAYALGRPAVATSVGGVPEVVRAGETGWLVEPGSIDSLVAAMREALLATPGRLAELAAAGREIVARKHGASETGRLLADAFRASVSAAPGERSDRDRDRA